MDGGRSPRPSSASRGLEIHDLLKVVDSRLNRPLAAGQRKLLEVLLEANSSWTPDQLRERVQTIRRGPPASARTSPNGALFQLVRSLRVRLDELAEGAGFEIVVEEKGSYHAERARLEALLPKADARKTSKIEQQLFGPGEPGDCPTLLLAGAGVLPFAHEQAERLAGFLQGAGAVFIFFAAEEKRDAIRLWILLELAHRVDLARVVLVAGQRMAAPGVCLIREQGSRCQSFIWQRRSGGSRGPEPSPEFAWWESGDHPRSTLRMLVDSASVPPGRQFGCFRVSADLPDAEADRLVLDAARLRTELQPRHELWHANCSRSEL